MLLERLRRQVRCPGFEDSNLLLVVVRPRCCPLHKAAAATEAVSVAATDHSVPPNCSTPGPPLAPDSTAPTRMHALYVPQEGRRPETVPDLRHGCGAPKRKMVWVGLREGEQEQHLFSTR